MIKTLAITQLVENTAVGPGLQDEHGNAFLNEADDHCLLFDTGQGLTFRDIAIILKAVFKCGEYKIFALHIVL